MAGKGGAQAQPQSVAEGMAEALRALSGAMTAPDAPTHAAELMALQAQMLTVFHKVAGTTGAPAQGQAPPGAAPPGAPPGGPPPGPPGGGGTNLALLQGGGGAGPSPAAPSGMSPDMERQVAAMGAAGGGT